MTREEMVEAAARAIREVVAGRSGRGQPWEMLHERLKNEYRAEATAALAAVGVLPDAAPTRNHGA